MIRELLIAAVVLIITVTATAWLNGGPRLSCRSRSRPEGRDWSGLVWQRHEQPLRAAQTSLHHSGHLHGRLLSPERPRRSS